MYQSFDDNQYHSMGALRAFMEAVNRGVDSKGRYICPSCGSGSHRNGTSAIKVSFDQAHGKAVFRCFACPDAHGDIFDWAGLMYGLDPKKDFPELKRIVSSFFGNPQTVSAVKGKRNGSAARTTEPESALKSHVASLVTFDATPNQVQRYNQYIRRRGLDPEFCDRYGVKCAVYHGKNGNVNFPKVFFPNHRDAPDAHCGKYRDIQPNGKVTYGCLGHQGFFNIDAIEQEKPVLIVEGEFDALSIEFCGSKAIALGSVNNAESFVDYVSSWAYPPPPFIIALDADEAGQRAANYLGKAFKARGMAYTTLAPDYFAPCKDANEYLMAYGRDALALILGVWA